MVIAPAAGGGMKFPIISYFHTELAKRGLLTVKFNFPIGILRTLLPLPIRKKTVFQSFRRIIEEVEKRYSPARLFIGGLSLGAYVASLLSESEPELGIDGLFYLGYPLHDPGKPERLLDDHLYRIAKPMLFVSGMKDRYAERDRLEEVVRKIGPNAEIHWSPDGDHLLNPHRGIEAYRKNLENAVNRLDEWSRAPLSMVQKGDRS